MGNSVNIVQLTNKNTEEIDGVTSVKRYELPEQIMLARLKAYSKYEPETEEVFFCDADSIFINKLSLPKNNKNKIFLTPRQQDFKINATYPEYYEEFVNKTAKEVMPFLFGAIATISNQQSFFRELYNICLKLPDRFHRWYGDQYSLNKFLDGGFDEYENLNTEIYLNILKEQLTLRYLENAINENVQLITFKGPNSKIYLEQSTILINYFYEKISI
tara:strand:- start:324 stop:974 length:651 start_codon:yes stop_codon:yes gene_type:complete